MPVDEGQLQAILSELFGLFETMETSNLAALRALTEKKIVSEDELKRLLDEAGNASSVKWRAARVRMEYLLTPVEKKKEEAGKRDAPNDKSKAEGSKPQSEEKKEEVKSQSREEPIEAGDKTIEPANAKPEAQPAKEPKANEAGSEAKNSKAPAQS